MKSILTFITIAIIGSAAFSSCQKYDYNPSMDATIDTIAFSAVGKPAVTAIVDTTTHNPQMVTITAKTSIYTPGSAVQPSIEFRIPNAVGTYYMRSTATGRVITSANADTLGSIGTAGQVVVLSNNGKIQGNFNFSCADGTKAVGHYIATLDFY